MLAVVLVVIGLVVLLFGFVIMFGAPFLPTLGKQVNTSLDLIDLKPGQTLLELGSGDGRLLIAAAKKGINAVGYELNPLLVIYSWVKTRKYRDNVKIIWGNYWTKNWPKADGIFVFLLPRYMKKLDKKIIRELSASPKPAFGQSPKLRFGFLRWALLRLPLLSQRSVSTPSSAAQPRLAQHQNAATSRRVKLVSFAFTIPGRKPVKKKDGIYLYEY